MIVKRSGEPAPNFHLSEFPLNAGTTSPLPPLSDGASIISMGVSGFNEAPMHLEQSFLPVSKTDKDRFSVRSSVFNPNDRSTPEPTHRTNSSDLLTKVLNRELHSNAARIEQQPISTEPSVLAYGLDNADERNEMFMSPEVIDAHFADVDPKYLANLISGCDTVPAMGTSPLKQPSGGGSATLFKSIPGWAEAAAKLVRTDSAAERAVAAAANGKSEPMDLDPILQELDQSFDAAWEERSASPDSPVRPTEAADTDLIYTPKIVQSSLKQTRMSNC